MTAVPATRERGLDYLMLSASDFCREEHTHLLLTRALHDPKLRQEFAAADVIIYRTLP